MAEVGSAFVSILPSMRGFGSKMQAGVGGEVDGAGKKMGTSFGKVFGAVAALGIGAKVAGFIGDSVSGLQRIEKINTQTAAAIKSTGGAAGVTAGHVERLAGRLENMTAMEAEATQEGANLLLTFTNVKNSVGAGNAIFDRATRAMVDMSTALGTDAKGSALQLGKALNDPVRGVSALQRVGVSFTQGQKDQIAAMVESGNTMKAQKVILKELEVQFGGSGQAFAKTTQGQVELAKHAIGTLGETMMAGLLPILGNLATTFTTKIAPAISTFITGMQSGVGVGGFFASVLSIAADALRSVGGFLSRNRDLVIPLVAAFAAGVVVIKTIAAVTKVWAVAQGVLNAVLAANPIGIVVVALAGLVAGLVVAYKRSETFRNIVNGVWNSIKTTVTTVVNAVRSVVTATWNAINATTSAAWNAVKNTVLVPLRLILAAVQGDTGKMRSIVSEAWAFVRSATAQAWDAVKNAVTKGIGSVLAAVREMPGRIVSGLGNLGSLLYSSGRDLIQGMIDGVRDMVGSLVSAAGDVVGSAINAARSKLGINSPSRVFLEIGHQTGEGLRIGLADMQGPVQRQMSRLALPDAAALVGPQVSLSGVSGGGSDVLGAKLDRVAAILERMPKAYRVGERQGA